MSDLELAWLAGLLEGEGCFSLHRRSPEIRLQMTDRDVVERVALLFGGRRVTAGKPRNWGKQTVFTTSTQGDSAVQIMRAIRPHMGERRGARIDELLGF